MQHFHRNPRPESFQTHSMCCGLAPSARVGKRDGEGLGLVQSLRTGETWLQNIKIPQGYEDDLDALMYALKESHKNDKDRPHFCRAIWRRKRARRRHVDRQKKLECCEEGQAPPGKPKSKHLNRHYDRPSTTDGNGRLIYGTRAFANTPVLPM